MSLTLPTPFRCNYEMRMCVCVCVSVHVCACVLFFFCLCVYIYVAFLLLMLTSHYHNLFMIANRWLRFVVFCSLIHISISLVNKHPCIRMAFIASMPGTYPDNSYWRHAVNYLLWLWTTPGQPLQAPVQRKLLTSCCDLLTVIMNHPRSATAVSGAT